MNLLSLIDPISTLLDKVIPDADLKKTLAHKLATMADNHAHEQVQAQLKVNEAEAKHKSVFVAGWRPFIGWVCGSALANNYMLIPYMTAFGLTVVPMDLATMLPILGGLLGLGGLRTVEKIKGVSREK